MKDEILYQIVAVDSDLIKGCPDKVTFISQREDMSDGIIYNDYDFKNHRYIKAYVSDNFNIYDRLEEKDKQLDKYKNVIDKIKEKGIMYYDHEYSKIYGELCNMPGANNTRTPVIVVDDDILELLEEVE